MHVAMLDSTLWFREYIWYLWGFGSIKLRIRDIRLAFHITFYYAECSVHTSILDVHWKVLKGLYTQMSQGQLSGSDDARGKML